MKKIRYSGCLLAAAVSSAAFFASAAQALTYRLTAIGNHESVSALNDLGQVVGQSEVPVAGSGPTYLPYFWSNGVSTDLGSLGIQTAFDINNRGQITGAMAYGSNSSHAYLYDGRSLVDLDPNGLYSRGGAINSAGVVAGEYVPPDGVYHEKSVVLFSGGTVKDLKMFPAENYVLGMNDSGDVVGGTNARKRQGDSRLQGFVVRDGVVNLLENFGEADIDGERGAGEDINNAGIAVGWADDYETHNVYAFVDSNGVKTKLEPFDTSEFSRAFGINDSGQIVGFGNGIHFLYSDGSVYDLDETLDSSAAGWLLGAVQDINNVGQIIGNGVDPSGNRRAYILTPMTAVPEPGTATLALAGFAVLGATVVRRRKRC